MYKAAFTYFLMVFATGFLLGRIGILWLPISIFSSCFINCQFPGSRQQQLFSGLLALGLSLSVELGVAVLLQGRSVWDAFFNRDPVSGTAYYFSLLMFGLMPWILDKMLTKPS